jgi:hypothetical protein
MKTRKATQLEEPSEPGEERHEIMKKNEVNSVAGFSKFRALVVIL